MKKQISAPLAIGAVVIVLVIVCIVGWRSLAPKGHVPTTMPPPQPSQASAGVPSTMAPPPPGQRR